MPFKPAAVAVLATLAIAGSARAEGYGGPGPAHGPRLHRPMRALPPEIRYRDPRFVPPPRRAVRLAPPTALIEAYLPRRTDTPMYNEPPSRFPQR